MCDPFTVLVVEDDPAIAYTLAEIGEAFGFTVRHTASPELARTLARTDPIPSAALIDIMLGGESGLELAKSLKEHPATEPIPLIAMSASLLLLAAARDTYLFTDLLPKPFDVTEVAQLVHDRVTAAAETQHYLDL